MASGIVERRGKKGTQYQAWVHIPEAMRTDSSKTRLYRTFPTRAAARSWRAETQRAIRQRTLRGHSGITFHEFAEQWLADAEAGRVTNRSGARYKPSVLLGYRAHLRNRLYPALGGKPLEQIDRRTLQALVDEWNREGLSGSTVRNLLMPVRVVLKRAIRRELIVADPCTHVDLPPTAPHRERIAGPEEARQLLAALPEEDRPLWAVALYAGLRIGEIQGLRWSDLDLAGRILHVRRAWDQKSRTFVAPKSKAGLRAVPIVQLVADELGAHRRRTRRRGDALVFGPDGRRPTPQATYLRRAKRAAADAGLQPLGLHEARHSAVSVWIAAGFNLKAITAYAGHSSVTTTINRYGHLLPGDHARDAAALDRFLGGGDHAQTAAKTAAPPRSEGKESR